MVELHQCLLLLVVPTMAAAKWPGSTGNADDMSQQKIISREPLPAGEAFRSIGRVELQKDLETTLTIRNADTDGFVILDALQLLPIP